MGQYYQYSLITIAVATPPNDPAGCFPPRPSGLNGMLARLPYIDQQGRKDGFVYVQERHGSVHDEYRNTILQSELLGRGWVLQEWLLSRRLIFITSNQLYFECQSKWPHNEYMETAHLGLDAGRISGRIHSEWKVPLKSLFSYKTKPIGDLWCTIVETYCTLQLTKPELDTFLAIAGIAGEIKRMIAQEATNGDATNKQREYYVAGLWLTDIHHGLLWEQRTRLNTIGSNPRAPTWSWASQSTPIKWQPRGKRVANTCEICALILPDGRSFDLNDTTEYENGSEDPGGVFGVTNSFAALKILSQRRLFLIHRHLTSSETTKISSYTGNATNFAGTWRAVSDPLSPTRHLGWASIESPSVSRQLGEENSIALQALHIARIRGESGGVKFGKLGMTHSVCCVVFIIPREDGRYERVGTGRIFQSQYFDGVQKEEVELV